MFYQHYEFAGRRLVFAAVMGEREGRREVFYTAIDYTDEPYFDDHTTHEKCREWLWGELRDYGFLPLDEPPRLSDLEGRIKAAVLKNEVKRKELMEQAKKFVEEMGNTPNELFEKGISH